MDTRFTRGSKNEITVGREQIPELMTDVLTNVLRSLRLRVGLLGRGDYSGNWALDFPDSSKAMFHLVGRGPVWLHCHAYAEPLELNEGDIVFFPQPQWHQLSATRERQSKTVVARSGKAGLPTRTLVSCTVEFESRSFDPILRSLPAVLIGHCQDEFASAELASLTRLVLSEYDGTTPGYEAMRERLAEALLIQLLRYCMRSAAGLHGLLRALADPPLSRVLAAIHDQPGREWDVAALATRANMSRSAFARRFGDCVGTSPMQYVSKWRMHLADQLLRDRQRSVAQVAEALGYRNEAAFRHAFKRLRGFGPGEARRAARGAITPRPARPGK